jgi:hypothetical protein
VYVDEAIEHGIQSRGKKRAGHSIKVPRRKAKIPERESQFDKPYTYG